MHRLTVLAAAALAVAANALGGGEISMVEREMTHIAVPFNIESYTPSSRDVLRIERATATSLRITALRPGRCDIEIRGDMDMAETFSVSVGGDLTRTLSTLKLELESVPEVTASSLGGFIRLEGEVKSMKRWSLLEKILENPRYAGVVRNYAEFSPSDEVLLRLGDTLEGMGLKVSSAVREVPPRPGMVNLAYRKSTRTLEVRAKVYTQALRDRIVDAMKRERWLSMDGANDGDFRIFADVDIEVVRPRLRISYAYLVIGEEDVRKLGNRESGEANGGGFIVKPLLSTLVKLVGGMRHDSGKAEVDLGLDAITRFFASESYTRLSERAFTVMESWGDEGSRFKSGGTLYVRVASSDAVDLKEVPYGFEIRTKGGMVSDDTASLSVEMEISSVQTYSDGSDIDRKEELSRQHLSCHLGKTTLIGGFSKLLEGESPASGLPIARNVPILKWFVSDSGRESTDRRLVMMICPEIVEDEMDAAIDCSRLESTVEDVKSPIEVTLESRKRFKGFWSFLNWFSF